MRQDGAMTSGRVSVAIVEDDCVLRDSFAALVTARINAHPNIEIIREEITEIPAGPVIIASGPLTSPKLATAIEQIAGDLLPAPKGEGINRRGVIATGDAFINDRATRDAIQARTGADLVEMEGAAIAYVASRHDAPWIVVRSVSDAGDGGADVSFDRHLPIAARNAATVVASILPAFST